MTTLRSVLNYFQDKKLPKPERTALLSTPFWGLLIAFVMLFFTGGSSRGDVQSLAILGPAMIICCGVALLTLRREHWIERKWLTGIVGFVFLLGLLYIVQLPVHLEACSPGLSTTADILAAANISGSPQTLAMAPQATLQSAFFLFAPLAVFLFAMQLGRDDLRLVLPLLIVLGTISGVFGILQLVGSASGPLYFYQITNNGSAVGLFANRNHAAVLLACLFPMLALVGAKSKGAQHVRNTSPLIAIAIAIILVPLILVTGSRSGMLTATVGLIGGALMNVSHAPSYHGSKTAKFSLPIWGAVILVSLVLVTIYFSRAEAIERIFAENSGAKDRADFWTSSLQLFWHYFPFGFGAGGFVPAFQNTEPLALLDGHYLNRLHNDWLETGLSFGVSGILLMLTGVGYYLRRSFVLWVRMDGQRSAVALGRMASIIIAILGIASLSDYPLRTPAMAGFAALVLVWFAHARLQPPDC